MLTIPPLYVRLEVGHKSVWASKLIRTLDSSEVPMIPFSSLVVVSQHTDTIYNVRKPIPKEVGGRHNWFWHPPYGHFHERIDGNNHAAAENWSGFHVGDNTNAQANCASPRKTSQ
jgi:hypothetical protein